MKRRVTALIIAAVMAFTAGCTSDLKVDPKTDVVKLDGIRADELVEKYGLDNTFEVSVDPDTGAVKIDGVPVSELGSAAKAEKPDDEEAAEDTKGSETGEVTRKTGKTGSDEDEESEDIVEDYPEMGVTLTLPAKVNDILGILSYGSSEISYGEDIYFLEMSYIGVSKEWVKELNKKEEVTDEEREKYYGSAMYLPMIISIGGDRDLADEIPRINRKYGEKMGYMLEEKGLTKLGKAGKYTFYRADSEGLYDQDNKDNLASDFKEEYDEIFDVVSEAIENAKIYEPVDVYADLIGKKLKFETTDLDGKKITSEELFGSNEITMVNIWATWCYWCVKELPELGQINERLQKKDCAVVGILGDADEEGKIEEGKELLEENGDTYINIVPWENAIGEDLPISAWPTTYFVGKDGTILAKPVTGAEPDVYEDAIDRLLKDNGSKDDKKDKNKDDKKDKNKDDKEDTAKTDSGRIKTNSKKEYRIFVTDENGDPVKDTKIQFCDDSTCRVGKTDEDGMAEFQVAEADYEVHVLKAPEGFEGTDETFELPDRYSDLFITLKEK